MPIAIIDYGAGNLRSVEKAFAKLGFESKITDDITAIRNSSAIVLPGVGAFDPAINELKEKKLFNLIISEINSGKLFLGLCLGMQLLFETSEEGKEQGFGIIKGTVKHFKNEEQGARGKRQGLRTSDLPVRQAGIGHRTFLKIPQMGWNNIKITKPSPIFKDVLDNSMMYFVHSYYCDPIDKDIISTTTDYGITFASSVSKDNVYALQFHPEKSSETGLKILKNFGELCKQ